MCNISHAFLDYIDTFLKTIHHILMVSMIKIQDIGSWFYYDCHLMGYLKIYLNIWILKKIKFMWVG